MITTFDIENILYRKLDLSSLKTAITGKIRKKERPAGSKLEDIVVNCLPVPNDQLQRTVANVNVFVPNQVINENGVQEMVINHARLKTLTDSVLVLLNDVMIGDVYYEVQQQQTIEDPESQSHFTNIRLNFYNINTQ